MRIEIPPISMRSPRKKLPKTEQCAKCYGKGYATKMDGGRVHAADFPGEKERREGARCYMVYCECERGKQLHRYVQYEVLREVRTAFQRYFDALSERFNRREIWDRMKQSIPHP